MTELKVFEYMLRNGKIEEAIQLASIEKRDTYWLTTAIRSGSIIVVNSLLSSGVHPKQTIYFDVVASDHFQLLQWMLKNRVGNKNHWGGQQTALDYAIYSGRPLFARLMTDYGCECGMQSSKKELHEYFKRRSQIRTICATIIVSPIGNKHTNAIIARVMWGMRLFISK